MIFQLDYLTVITLVLISYLGVSLILFIAGTYIMQMYAKLKNWEDSFKIPLKINIIWLILGLAIGIPLTLLVGDQFFIDFIRFGVNLIAGAIFAERYYKKERGESIQFILVIQFILTVLGLVFGSIFSILTQNVLLI